MCEEREVPADMLNREVVGVRENVGREPALAQFGVQGDGAGHFGEDLGEIGPEFRQIALKPDGVPNDFIELHAGELAAFILAQDGGTA